MGENTIHHLLELLEDLHQDGLFYIHDTFEFYITLLFLLSTIHEVHLYHTLN